MAENEIEVAGELGLPFTAKLSLRYRRRWTDRANKFLDDVTIRTGLDLERIENRMEDDERLEDLVLEGVAKAGRVSDPDYREALARVVAAAFGDGAKVDEVEQLTGQLITLDPFSLRVLRAAYRRGHVRYTGDRPVSARAVGKALGTGPGVVTAAFARLSGLGFLTATQLYDTSEAGSLTSLGMVWSETTWGARAVGLCFQQLDASDTKTLPE